MRKRLTIVAGGLVLLMLCIGANISQWPFSPSPANGWFLVWSNAVLTWTPDLSAGTGTISATIVGYATSNVLWLASSNLVYQGTNGLTTGAFTPSNTAWVSSSNLVYQGTNGLTTGAFTSSNTAWVNSSNLVWQGTNGLTTGAFTSSNTAWVNSSNLVYQGTNGLPTGAFTVAPTNTQASGLIIEGTSATSSKWTNPPVVLFFVSREGNPAASTVYHFGGIAQNWTTATATHPQYYQVYVPFTGKVAAAYVHGFVGGTLGTAGTVGLEITNVTAATSVSLTGVALTAVFNDSVTTGLSFAVTAGDYIAIRVTTPAWATPAAGVAWQANLWLQ